MWYLSLLSLLLSRHTWHHCFLAGAALGGIIAGVALSAEQQLILGRKGLFHQRAAALSTLETLLMPVPVLVGQVLGMFDIIYSTCG